MLSESMQLLSMTSIMDALLFKTWTPPMGLTSMSVVYKMPQSDLRQEMSLDLVLVSLSTVIKCYPLFKMPSPSPLFTPYSSWHSLLSIYPIQDVFPFPSLYQCAPIQGALIPPPLSLSPLQASFPLPSLYPYSRCLSPPLFLPPIQDAFPLPSLYPLFKMPFPSPLFTPYSRCLSPPLSLPPIQDAVLLPSLYPLFKVPSPSSPFLAAFILVNYQPTSCWNLSLAV